MPFITIEIDDCYDVATDDDGNIRLPAKWAICDGCDGEGHHAKHIGGMVQQDLDEGFRDVIEDYMGGVYDRKCEDCDGTGKVLVVDAEACERDDNLRKALEAKRQMDQFDLDDRRAVALERAFGA
jgi:hypothetical protein